MKSISFTAVLVVVGSVAGLAQTPRKPLASIFQSKLAFYLPAPDSAPISTSISAAAGEGTTISQNTWIEIHGQNLSTINDDWSKQDFSKGLPTSLDGVTATVNGKAAFVYYISPTQINVLTPIDSSNPLGSVAVQVKNSLGTTPTINATFQQYSLGFFAFNSDKYAAAVHGLGDCAHPETGTCFVGPNGVFASAPGWTTPAKPGESIILYGSGFGQPNPPTTNGAIPTPSQLATKPVITLGNIPVQVDYAGLVAAGEYQFNIVVPPTAPDGDLPLSATYNGFTSTPGVFVTVKK